jgi:asparagine synthase (glutamine-hydrolysing)
MSVIVAAVCRSLSPESGAWVREAAAFARSAGPDGHRVHTGETCALGHALMRTDDRQLAQPISLDGEVWLTADARLDDRAGLIAALGPHTGRIGAGTDDAELLLHAYAAWGDAFLDRVAGDFAFALWDSRRRRLLCARDQIGIVPLHYVELRGCLLVASSPELLLLHPHVPDHLDEAAIADFLLAGQPSDFGATAFLAVRCVAPAHTLSWDYGQVRLRRYWRQADFAPLLRLRRRGDYIERFGGLLQSAVDDRVPSGPLAVQLSGGMDSTTVAALASRSRHRRPGIGADLRGVTAVLGGDSGDREGDYARLAADWLQIGADVVDESTRAPTDPFAPPRPLTPEPTPYQWTDAGYQLAAIAADHARVCLSGLGADPLLTLVPWYWAEWLAAGHVVRLALAFADHVRLFGDRPHLGVEAGARFARQARTVFATPPPWMDAGLAARVDATARLRALAPRSASMLDRRNLSAAPAWQAWFTWADPGYTGLALRFRHPMTDLRLIDFAARVAPHPWFEGKRILREATEGLLPDSVRERPKTPRIAASRASATPAAADALCQLVRAVPAAERFVDPESLMAAIRTPRRHDWDDRQLSFALGLVHWLAHWRRPIGPGSLG